MMPFNDTTAKKTCLWGLLFLLVLSCALITGPKLIKMQREDSAVVDALLSYNAEAIHGLKLMPLNSRLDVETIHAAVWVDAHPEVVSAFRCLQSRRQPGEFLGSFEHWTTGRILRVLVYVTQDEFITVDVSFHSERDVCEFGLARDPASEMYESNVVSIGCSDELAATLYRIIEANGVHWRRVKGD